MRRFAVIQNKIAITALRIRTRRTRIDAKNAFDLFRRRAVGMPVQGDIAIELLCPRNKAGNSAFYAVTVTVTAKYTSAFRLNHQFLFPVCKIAVAAAKIRFLGKLGKNAFHIGRTVAEMYDIIVFRNQRQDSV